jgi:uncharacterized protein with HEPN domain
MLLDSDAMRLHHILESAELALKFCAGKDFQAFASDQQLQLAVARCIEIIGEAASRLSPDFRSRHVDIPWGRIIGTRNRLAHAYFDVDLEMIWATVTAELPRLRSQLR